MTVSTQQDKPMIKTSGIPGGNAFRLSRTVRTLRHKAVSTALDLGGFNSKPLDPLKSRPDIDLRPVQFQTWPRREKPRPPQIPGPYMSIPLPEFFPLLAPNPYISRASCFFPPSGPHMTAALCAVITACLTPCASRWLASPCLRLCPLLDAPVSPSNGQ
jgi:hypothetical protein